MNIENNNYTVVIMKIHFTKGNHSEKTKFKNNCIKIEINMTSSDLPRALSLAMFFLYTCDHHLS